MSHPEAPVFSSGARDDLIRMRNSFLKLVSCVNQINVFEVGDFPVILRVPRG
jgi:hypothetical protein